MDSSDDTMPIRNPATTRTTDHANGTQVHIQRLSRSNRPSGAVRREKASAWWFSVFVRMADGARARHSGVDARA